ncbi:hypothetical protein ES707_11034 [subsurface metagenome]
MPPKTDFHASRTNLPFLDLNGPLTLKGNGVVEMELRPGLDQAEVAGVGKPTIVTRGVLTGYSLPLYAANQEIFFGMCIPHRWDGVSDIELAIHCYLAAAEDDHAFRLQVSWERTRTTTNQVVLITSQDLEVETNTGALAAQFTSYHVDFDGENAIPYDMGGHELQVDDELSMRLRRVNKEGAKDECAGDIVIFHIGLIFHRNKLGTPL